MVPPGGCLRNCWILISLHYLHTGGSGGKVCAYNAGDWGLIPRSRRSPGEGNGNPLQYSCLENPMDTVHRVAKSWTRLSDFTFTFTLNPLQYCLENPMNRGAWQAPVHGIERVRHDLATKAPPPPSHWPLKKWFLQEPSLSSHFQWRKSLPLLRL